MARAEGRFLTELRRSNASGSHGKRPSDRYNSLRKTIEQELALEECMTSLDPIFREPNGLDDFDGPSPTDILDIEADLDYDDIIRELEIDDYEIIIDDDGYDYPMDDDDL